MLYSTDPLHNRLRMQVDRRYPADSTQFQYDSSGARLLELPYVNEQPTTTQFGYRQYKYDGLGRTTGTNEFQCTSWDPVSDKCTGYGTASWTSCQYDGLGRMFGPCENFAVYLGFDGENTVRTAHDTDLPPNWTVVHGPGVDDPLMGHYTTVSGVTAYWMTDGAGRQLAVGDPDGYDCTSGSTTTCGHPYIEPQNGGKFAGGTTNVRSFRASRDEGVSVTRMSFFRNRWYDQQTGRWTQEDPIGVGGGLNLYGFASGDPVNFSDPFGLCPPEDPEPCSIAERLAIWGAKHSHGWAVNLGAALQAGATVADAVMGGGCDNGYTCGMGIPAGPAGFGGAGNIVRTLQLSDRAAELGVGGLEGTLAITCRRSHRDDRRAGRESIRCHPRTRVHGARRRRQRPEN